MNTYRKALAYLKLQINSFIWFIWISKPRILVVEIGFEYAVVVEAELAGVVLSDPN